MSEAPTLNSRLRVLIAKTFRAEKLYASVRNTQANKISSMANVSEVANDIRAKEWQKSHYELRLSLNDAISIGKTTEVINEVSKIRNFYQNRALENTSEIQRISENLIKATSRQEFTHTLKLSFELVKTKANTQASKAIVDELTSILNASGVNVESRKPRPHELPLELQEVAKPKSNIIPLKRQKTA